jgi:hypothetical protein
MIQRTHFFHWNAKIAVVLVILLAPVARAGGPAPAATKKKVPFSQYVRAQVTTTLDTLVKDHDYDAATKSLQTLFDQAVLHSPAEQVDSIREADFALRLVTQLSAVPTAQGEQLLPFLRKHDDLAHTLVFLIRPGDQGLAGTYALLNRLREKRADKLDQYSTLAAALCVVHNRPRTIRANENEATSADPLELFDYYVKNESRMYYGIKNVPPELLIYVVDTTASIPEMEWALSKYAGDSEVGKLFFTIKYDYAYLKSGGDKKLTKEGFSLPNIAAFGGVCVDQSYFAATVGKAIGVPAMMDTGSSGEAGHAWVGFLQLNGRTAVWNLNEGRYQSYQGVEGSVQDPQTRQQVPDSYVSLLAEMIGTKSVDRQNCVALTDAAIRLEKLNTDAIIVPPPDADSVAASTFSAKPRLRDTAAELALVQSALRQSVAYTPAWFVVRDLAVAKKLTLAQKREWSDLLLRLGAKKYPEFTLSVLMPMVQTIEDPAEQDQLLSRIQPLFATRKDLTASIRMAQASLWESQKQTDRAGQCYMDVVERFSNDGPFVLDALAGAEKLLVASKRSDQVVTLYEQAWSRTKKPVNFAPEFLTSSNWYRIGKLLADKLKNSGDTVKSEQVEAALKGSPPPVAGKGP